MLPIPEPTLWPKWLWPAIDWMTTNHIGDIASVLGVVVSIIGFFVTFLQLIKSKRAAQAAAEAANRTRQSLAYVTALSDFSAAIEILEEIKRFHRNGVLQPLPDRYTALRKILIVARSGRGDFVGNEGLTDDQKATIQAALVNLSNVEQAIDRAISGGAPVDFPRLNRILSKDIDQLQEVLVHLKSLAGGQ